MKQGNPGFSQRAGKVSINEGSIGEASSLAVRQDASPVSIYYVSYVHGVKLQGQKWRQLLYKYL